MLIGSDGLELIDFGDFELARRSASSRSPSSSSRAACRPASTRSGRCCATSIALATLGTLGTAALTAVAAGLLFRARAAGGAAARLDGGRHRRRGHLRRAARLDAAPPARAHARGRVGHQRPDRDPARDRLHRGAPGRHLRARGRAAAGRARALDRLRRRPRGRRRRRCCSCAASRCRPPACTRSRRWPPGALAFGAAQTLHGSGFLAVFLAGLVLGTASTPARRTIVTFHEGLAWVAQLGLFLTLGLLVFPDRARSTSRPRARRSPSSPPCSRGRLAAVLVPRSGRVQRPRAADARLGRPARRDADRVRHLPGHRRGSTTGC